MVSNASADTIDLKRSVRMPLDRDELILRDVAELDGSQAADLAETVVYRAADATIMQQIALDDLREALEAAGADWSVLHISGGDVMVRPRPHGAVHAPRAMSPARIEAERSTQSDRGQSENALFRPASFWAAEKDTIRRIVLDRILHELGRADTDVQLQFMSGDEPFLAQVLDNQRVEIEPISSFDSDRIVLIVRVWRGSDIIESATVAIPVLVRAEVPLLAQDIGRDQVISTDSLIVEERWLPPSQAKLLARSNDVIGRRVERSLQSGDLLRPRDTAPEKVIERGDAVTVRCLSGGVVITFSAEARNDAARGEFIELRRPGERDTFTATAAAPGEAVLDLSK